MLKLMKAIIGALVISLAQSSYAQSPDVAPEPSSEIDPFELLELTSEYIEAKSSIELGWFVTYDVPLEGGAEQTLTWGGESILTRGRGYYAVSERGDSVKEYYYDGETFTARDLGENYHATVPVSGDFDTLVKTLQDDHGLTLPVWEMMSTNLSDDMLGDVTGGANLGLTRVMGQWAYHLSFTEPEQDWEIWISADDEKPLPLMMAGRYNDEAKTQYQALFHKWSFKPRRKRSTFKLKRKPTERKIPFATLKAAQSPGGDFETDAMSSSDDK